MTEPVFYVTDDHKLAVDEDGTVANNKRLPSVFRLMRDFILDTGAIPEGAICRATLCTAYDMDNVLSLRFDLWWPALRQWNNELLLFPNCVDYALLDCLQMCFYRSA